MIDFPLQTERLTLTPLDRNDRDAFVSYRRDPQVALWQSWTSDYSVEEADALLSGQPERLVSQSGHWLQVAIRVRGQGVAGDVAVHAVSDQPDTYEIGVTLARNSQGQGYAREAVGGVVDELLRHGAHRLFAQSDERNSASARVFQALGFRHEARHVDADWFKGEWTTLDVWALLASEATSSSASRTATVAQVRAQEQGREHE